MRTTGRSLMVFLFLCGAAIPAQSEPVPETDPQPAPAPQPAGVNQLYFATGSPKPVVDGVDVTVEQRTATGYTCTEIIIRVIDPVTGKTLGTEEILNPGNSVTKSFRNLGSGVTVQVTADATYKSGTTFDTKFTSQNVTTK